MLFVSVQLTTAAVELSGLALTLTGTAVL